MSHVLLFHHALGLTAGVGAFADELRAAGHQVTVPDLYDGRTFASVEEGVAHAEGIGFDAIVDAGVDDARQLAEDVGGEIHLYPGDDHLFTDRSLDAYDPDAAQLVVERTLAFLDGLG